LLGDDLKKLSTVVESFVDILIRFASVLYFSTPARATGQFDFFEGSLMGISGRFTLKMRQNKPSVCKKKTL